VLYSGGTSSNKCVKERAPYEAEEIRGDFVFSYRAFSDVQYIN
jgi:hypothetical protein